MEKLLLKTKVLKAGMSQFVHSQESKGIIPHSLKRSVVRAYFNLFALFFTITGITAQTYNFTNAGATGRFGPSQGQLNSAYTSTNLAGNVTSINGIQSWIVPFSGTYQITAAGAEGGNGTSTAAGLGATMTGTFALNAGDELRIIVGQRGINGTGGSGGGASFVVNHTAGVPLLVGAGGGGAHNTNGQPGTVANNGTTNGGNQGSTWAAAGGGYSTNGANNTAGATFTCLGGLSYLNGGLGGESNRSAEGGFGGGGAGMSGCGGACGAGGGGGYNGGNSLGDYGFGGGSYNIGTNQTNQSGNRSGNGFVQVIVIDVVGSDIAVLNVNPISNVPNAVCVLNEYDFDVTLRSNGPGFRTRVNLQIAMEGMDTLLFENFSIADLAVGQTKTYRFSSKKMFPKKAGNYVLSATILNSDDDNTNNRNTRSIVVNNQPSGSVIQTATPYPGFPGQGTPSDRDVITYGKTYVYTITPPTKFTNSQHGTQWQSVFSATLDGVTLPGSRYNFTPPTGNNNATVSILLLEADVEGNLILNFNVKDLTGTGCDTNATRHIYVAPMPKPIFQGTSVCLGEGLQFQNFSTINSGGMNFEWIFGDGNSSRLFEPKYTYDTTGLFQVKLIATSLIGFKDSLTLPVLVSPTPKADFSFTNQCGSLPIAFTNASSIAGGTMNYLWSFGDGKTSNQASPVHTYTGSGAYDVTLEIESDKGCFASMSKSAYSYPAPKADFLSSNQLCAGVQANFMNTTSISFSNWGSEWIFGDNEKRTFEKNPSYRFKTAGSKTVTLKVTTQYGCVDSVSKNIEVLAGPYIDITHSDVCINNDIVFSSNVDVPAGMQADFIWNIAGSLYAVKEPIVRINEIGTKQVSVSISYANGCTAQESKQVSAGYKPKAAFALGDAICSGQEVELENLSTIDFDIPNYTWDMGDGNTYNSFAPSHTYGFTSPTPVSIRLIASSSNGACPDTVVKNVTVGIVPVCGFTITPSYLPGHRGYKFDAQASDAQLTWYFGDGKKSTEKNPTYQYSRDGLFEVRLVAKTNEGCMCESVFMHDVYNLSVQTPSGLAGLHLYPNPTNGTFNLANQGDIKTQRMEIYNTVGALVKVFAAEEMQDATSFDISTFAPGVYTVRIQTIDGSFGTYRLLLSK